MKRSLCLLAALCCAFALCASLMGCGANVDKSLYTGTWTLASTSDKNLDEDTIELMRSMDAAVDLVLNEDGSGTFTPYGESMKSISWKATSNTEGTATIDGAEVKLSLADGKLTLSDNGNATMTFVKKDTIASTSASTASAASSASASSSGETSDASASSGSTADASSSSSAAA